MMNEVKRGRVAMSQAEGTQTEQSKVDCAKLGSEATLILEYRPLRDKSGSLLGKTLCAFNCEQRHKCEVGQARETPGDLDWEACPYHKAFTRKTP